MGKPRWRRRFCRYSSSSRKRQEVACDSTACLRTVGSWREARLQGWKARETRSSRFLSHKWRWVTFKFLAIYLTLNGNICPDLSKQLLLNVIFLKDKTQSLYFCEESKWCDNFNFNIQLELKFRGNLNQNLNSEPRFIFYTFSLNASLAKF